MRRPQLHEEAVSSRRPAPGDKAAASANLKTVYQRLFKAFGPQGWWPVTPSGGLFPLYTPGFYGPLPEEGLLEICVGAILTQNTSWKNAEKALCALKKAKKLSLKKIAACPPPALAALIRSSGYHNRKAAKLKALCRRVLREHPEGLKAWFARAAAAPLRAELLSYNGVGPETADSIALYAARKPVFVIDAYARRIAGRLGLAEGLSYDGWQARFERNLPRDLKMYNEYHALLVKLGKDFCRKTGPLCAGCPLNRVCLKKYDKHREHRKISG